MSRQRIGNFTPKQGDVVYVLACCDAGPRFVMKHIAEAGDYVCGSCKRRPRPLESVTLGPDGALPDGWTSP